MQNLDRYGAVESGISGAVDFTHSASTERGLDLVRPELCASG